MNDDFHLIYTHINDVRYNFFANIAIYANTKL